MTIPSHAGKIPLEPTTLKNSVVGVLWSSKKVRVCNECADELLALKSLESLIEVFNLLPLTIVEYQVIRSVNKTWNKLGAYYLSKFRELQYRLPYQEFSDLDRALLRNNEHLIAGHSSWVMAFIQCFGYLPVRDSSELATIPCKTLMCSRICNPELRSFEMCAAIRYTKNPTVLLDQLAECNEREILCYLPTLLAAGQDDFLLQYAKRSRLIAGYLYWEWEICENCDRQQQLLRECNQDTVDFINGTRQFVHFLTSLDKRMTLDRIKTKFADNAQIFNKLRLPTAPDMVCKRVLIDKIRVKDSSSRPIFIPMSCYNEKTGGTELYYLLLKFEDVRQDKIVIDTLRVMDLVLKSELGVFKSGSSTQDLDIKIVTYNVFPVSPTAGLVEIIPNCHTLYDIEKNFTIFNYILENNRGQGLSADVLRRRFLQSCAAYCVMTFLLGVGDRHLENIMINTEGYFFHIDYGFVIGADPKPVTAPAMRITSGMVDALGGLNSSFYKEFIQLSQDIHLCLQKRLPIFFCILELLIPIQTNRLTQERFINELIKRFMYGENYEQSGAQLSVHISNSSGSYNQALIDFFHYHKHEGTVTNVLSGAASWIGSLFK